MVTSSQGLPGRGEYLVGLDAERVLLDNHRRKVEKMKTSLTPDLSRHGSTFELSPSTQVTWPQESWFDHPQRRAGGNFSHSIINTEDQDELGR